MARWKKKRMNFITILIIIFVWFCRLDAAVILIKTADFENNPTLKHVFLRVSLCPDSVFYSDSGVFEISYIARKPEDKCYLIFTQDASFPSIYQYDFTWGDNDSIVILMKPKRFWDVRSLIEIDVKSNDQVSGVFLNEAIGRLTGNKVSFLYPLTNNIVRMAIVFNNKQTIVKNIRLELKEGRYYGRVKISKNQLKDVKTLSDYFTIIPHGKASGSTDSSDQVVRPIETKDNGNNDVDSSMRKDSLLVKLLKPLKLDCCTKRGSYYGGNISESVEQLGLGLCEGKYHRYYFIKGSRIFIDTLKSNSSVNGLWLLPNAGMEEIKNYSLSNGEELWVHNLADLKNITLKEDEHFAKNISLAEWGAKNDSTSMISLAHHWSSHFRFFIRGGGDLFYMHSWIDSLDVIKRDPNPNTFAGLPFVNFSAMWKMLAAELYFRGFPFPVKISHYPKTLYFDGGGFINFDLNSLGKKTKKHRIHYRLGIGFTGLKHKVYPEKQAEDNLFILGGALRFESLFFSRNGIDRLWHFSIDKLITGGHFKRGNHNFFLPHWLLQMRVYTFFDKPICFKSIKITSVDVRFVPPFDYEVTPFLKRKAWSLSAGFSITPVRLWTKYLPQSN